MHRKWNPLIIFLRTSLSVSSIKAKCRLQGIDQKMVVCGGGGMERAFYFILALTPPPLPQARPCVVIEFHLEMSYGVAAILQDGL